MTDIKILDRSYFVAESIVPSLAKEGTMLSATNYDPSSLSNELFLFSFSVQLFRQHDRFGQITHGTAQPAAFRFASPDKPVLR
jgi:hypothetical protein